ncbi:MAG TPA: hypothetical protein VED40_05035 [Azospirillaceae bacterium]|nr:hypothetical protein [Azospirillaceae bacterium]
MNVGAVQNATAALAPGASGPGQRAAAAPGSAASDRPVAGSAPAELPRYLSPVIQVDNVAAMALIQFRDGDTGDVKTQIPSERVVQEYRLRGPGGSSRDGKAVETGAVPSAAPTQGSAAGAAPAGPPTAPSPVSATPAGGSSAAPTAGSGSPALNVVA